MTRILLAAAFAMFFSSAASAGSYAVLDGGGIIVNRVVIDDPAAWTPPQGHSVVAEPSSGYAIGGSVVAGNYTPPSQSLPVPPNPMSVAEASRQAGIKSDAQRAALLVKLQGATNAQIDAYVAANVTNLAQAQTAIATILKLIALDARQ